MNRHDGPSINAGGSRRYTCFETCSAARTGTRAGGPPGRRCQRRPGSAKLPVAPREGSQTQSAQPSRYTEQPAGRPGYPLNSSRSDAPSALDGLAIYTALALLGLICLSWTLIALPCLLLPARLGVPLGRRGIRAGFHFYVRCLERLGVYRFDLAALQALRDAPPLVLAPNHPSIIDALLIIAHEPRVACVLKAALLNNVFMGAGARLAGYIRHEPPRRMIQQSLAELARGGIVLLFPEGTRTTSAPINSLQAGVGIIARQAGVPVQTLIFESDSPYASKGWSLFRPARRPISIRVRLGERFAPRADVRALMSEVEAYYRQVLAGAPQNEWLGERAQAGTPAHVS